MKNLLPTTAIPTSDHLWERLYHGEVFLLPANPASLRAAEAINALLVEVFGDNPREVHTRLDDRAFFEGTGSIRRVLFYDRHFHALTREVIAAAGFDPDEVAYDPMRLRAIKHDGHSNPRASPVYYAHRDTWYGHPQSMVTWWIPLDDLDTHETFVFYPAFFAREVPNDSEIFDYRDWIKEGPDLRIGWQQRDAGLTARYPQVTEVFDPGPELGFSCQRGQNLLFAGSQFHRTLPQDSGLTRFSVDFRLVHLGHHASGLGAPNADNRSRGSALKDYIQPAAT
jgi:hypothetical protein